MVPDVVRAKTDTMVTVVLFCRQELNAIALQGGFLFE
jgi:hypothetical protein